MTNYNMDLITIEGDLQYIDNFLTQEELDFLNHLWMIIRDGIQQCVHHIKTY